MKKNRAEALSKLKQAREGKESRVSQYSVFETEDALIELTEEEYKKQVAERNKKKFIVDDLGIGYEDEGEFDLGQEVEESYESEEKAETDKNGSLPITNFLMNGLTKRPKIAPLIDKEKKENLKASLFSMLEDDTVQADDILSKKTLQKPKNENLMTISRSQPEDLNKKYSIPISKLTTSLKEIEEKPMLPDQALENRKRKEPGSMPEPFIASQEPQALIQEKKFFDIPTNQNLKNKAEKFKIEEKSEAIQESFTNNLQSFEASNSEVDILPEKDIEMSIEPDQNTIETLTLEDDPELPIKNGSLHMYWLDAYEDRSLLPGSVLLFGKVYLPNSRKYGGICAIIQELTKTFYILPKPEYQEKPEEVDKELEYYRKKYNIRKWSKTLVARRYSFEFHEIPYESEYIKVRYESKYPSIDFGNTKTFSHSFGTHTSLIETLLVKRKLKGPCWIKLENVFMNKNKFSNCKFEVTVANRKNVVFGLEESNMQPPSLVMMSLAIKTKNNSKPENEFFAISATVHNNIDQVGQSIDNSANMAYFSLVNVGKPMDRFGINEFFLNENDLLQNFLNKIQQIDPDIISSHDLVSDVLEKLASRLHHTKPRNWTNLSRVLLKSFPNNCKDDQYSGNWKIRSLTAGRLLLDTVLSSKELIKETTYTLSALMKRWFNIERSELEFEVAEALEDKKKTLIIADHTKKDSSYIHQIVGYLNVIPLTKQLSNIAGNLWARSLMNQRAERNEMLLIHKFHELKFIIPDKTDKKLEKKSEKKKNQYSGGLVLSPIAGLYDKFVILLDFNSLYPSIIREFNICFTTVQIPSGSTDQVDNRPGTIKKDSDPGILPEIITHLVNTRRATKAAMKSEKNPLRLKQLDIKQQALKLTANSLYGCLGFKNSRFYARAIAALITQLGRNTLENTVKIAKETLNLEVIYGDTDSIMINTNLATASEAVKKGDELKRIVNKQFKHLEIELDGIFKSMLLLKKKKYAAIKIENGKTKREVKGLDMVRRDWSELSKKVSSNVLDLILSDYSKEEIAENIKAYIELFVKEYESSTLGEFIIYKQLTKAVDKYKDQQNQPHVQVAKRLIEKGQKNIEKHYIPYVICETTEGNDNTIAFRAYHPDEVASSQGLLKPDKKWYINQQIIPPIQRLIAPIDFLKIGEIVELLGEDSSKYKIVEKENNQNFYYKGDPVFAKCWNSEHPAYNLTESEKKVNCPLCPLSNALENYAKNAILKHLKMKKMSAYNSGLQCTEFNCKNTTKQRNLKNCNKFQCPGKMVSVYSLNQFFMELSNLERLVEKAYPGKNKFVRTLLDQCKFAVVKLSSFQANTAVDYRKLIEY